MGIWPKGSLSGNVPPRGAVTNGDCFALIEFAVPAEPPRLEGDQAFGRVHVSEVELLCSFLAKNPQLSGLPIYANPYSADYNARYHQRLKISHVFGGGNSSSFLKENTGTWGELEQIPHHRPILVGQAHHIGRVAAQAVKQGRDPIVVPELLVHGFDPASSQIWTRNEWMWRLRELPGVLSLRARGHL